MILKAGRNHFLIAGLHLQATFLIKFLRFRVFQGNDETTKFLNSLHYTDEVLGLFIENCKKQSWWKNTVIIITADHGIRFPVTGRVVNDFKIPMLWLGGPVKKKAGLVINKLASQIDLSATLNESIGLEHFAFSF
jgi:phosphoglycerol transferase MdoB-like AlkP superfamily enzyme